MFLCYIHILGHKHKMQSQVITHRFGESAVIFTDILQLLHEAQHTSCTCSLAEIIFSTLVSCIKSSLCSITSCKQGNPQVLLRVSSQSFSCVALVRIIPCGYFIKLASQHVSVSCSVSMVCWFSMSEASASFNNSVFSACRHT